MAEQGGLARVPAESRHRRQGKDLREGLDHYWSLLDQQIGDLMSYVASADTNLGAFTARFDDARVMFSDDPRLDELFTQESHHVRRWMETRSLAFLGGVRGLCPHVIVGAPAMSELIDRSTVFSDSSDAPVEPDVELLLRHVLDSPYREHGVPRDEIGTCPLLDEPFVGSFWVDVDRPTRVTFEGYTLATPSAELDEEHSLDHESSTGLDVCRQGAQEIRDRFRDRGRWEGDSQEQLWGSLTRASVSQAVEVTTDYPLGAHEASMIKQAYQHAELLRGLTRNNKED